MASYLDEAGLEELWRLISGIDDVHAAEIALRVQVATGNYVGTGTYGSSNPNKLTFSFAPQFVIVAAVDSTEYYLFFRDGSNGFTDSGTTATWSGNTLSWYASSASDQLNQGASVVPGQGNVSAKTYRYVAFGL